MRMASNNRPQISEEEMKRRQVLLNQHLNDERLRKREHLYRNLTTDLRRFLSITLTATCVILAFSHRTLIVNKISQIITKIQNNAKNSQIRKSALKHEEEIDQIAK